MTIDQEPVLETDMTPTIGALAAALAKAQGDMTGAKKDAVAEVQYGNGPVKKRSYADLASVWEAIRKPLSANGLAVLQLTEPHGLNVVCVVTLLAHASGEYVRTRLVMPVMKQDAQGFGSALTYARRYALAAICGIAPEDDDGEGGSSGPREPHPPLRQERPAPPAQTGPATNGKNTIAESEAAKAVAHAMQGAARDGDRSAVMLHYTDAANRKPAFSAALMKRLGEVRDEALEACSDQQGAAQ